MQPLRTLSATVLAAAVVLVPGSAAASCAAPAGALGLDGHDLVFAGEVGRTTHGGGAAEVRVLDVWRGPDLPPRVVVVGGQLRRGVASSVDRSFQAGERYAFFPVVSDDGSLRDNACSPTAPLSSRAPLDPPGTRPPVPGAAAPTDPRSLLSRSTPATTPVLAVAAVLGWVGLASAAARRWLTS